MDNIFKKYYKAMVYYSFFLSLIIVLCCVRTNYEITTPGGVSKVDQRFDVDTDNVSNNLYSLYVYSTKKSTLFQNIIASFVDSFDKEKINDNYSHMTDAMWNEAGVIQKEQSQEACLINAYELAMIDNKDIYIEYNYLGVIVRLTTSNNNVFEIGDIITSVNDELIVSKNQFSDSSREDYIKINYQDKIAYINNGVEKTHIVQEEDVIEMALYDKFKIVTSFPSYQINSTTSLGPSAGMMQTLSIYNQLVDYDISNNKKIAGTGTI